LSGKGSNSIKLRHYNERFVLASLRKLGEASKSDLARAAKLTPAAVSDIMDGLERSGFVKQVGKRLGKRGSPSILYVLNPDRIYSIGIKIGRKAMEAILMNFTGEICDREEHEYDYPDPEQIAQAGNEIIKRFSAKIASNKRSSLIGIGIAAPYFLGSWVEELKFPEDLGQRWGAVNLATLFDIGPNTEVFIENDATSAALAELFLGVGEAFSDFMHISIDTCIGGGLVQSGRVHTGPHGNSAALGPLPVSLSALNSAKHNPARYTSLLHRASIFVLQNHLVANGISINRIRQLETMGDNARRPVQEWTEDCAHALVEGIIAITSVIDLEAIIIDSILPRDLHAELIVQVQKEFSNISAVGIVPPQILSGKFGPLASPVGAASLPISALLSPNSSVLMLGDKANSFSGTLSGSR
jgi:predicted NBD/HSP70 family sugar kinase